MQRHKDQPHQHCTLPRETNFKFQETIAGCLGDAQASHNKEQSTEARGRARCCDSSALIPALVKGQLLPPRVGSQQSKLTVGEKRRGYWKILIYQPL